MENIPKDLFINWDFVLVSKWTMAKEGSTRVEIVGLEERDK
jgi:hypothetical protein